MIKLYKLDDPITNLVFYSSERNEIAGYEHSETAVSEGFFITASELEQREREAWDAALEILPPVATDKGMRSKYEDSNDYLKQRNREQALSELVADGEKSGDYDDQAS